MILNSVSGIAGEDQVLPTVVLRRLRDVHSLISSIVTTTIARSRRIMPITRTATAEGRCRGRDSATAAMDMVSALYVRNDTDLLCAADLDGDAGAILGVDVRRQWRRADAYGLALYRPGQACPADPELAAQCEKIRRWNSRFFRISVGIWLAGFGSAYLALPIYLWAGGD